MLREVSLLLPYYLSSSLFTMRWERKVLWLPSSEITLWSWTSLISFPQHMKRSCILLCVNTQSDSDNSIKVLIISVKYLCLLNIYLSYLFLENYLKPLARTVELSVYIDEYFFTACQWSNPNSSQLLLLTEFTPL